MATTTKKKTTEDVEPEVIEGEIVTDAELERERELEAEDMLKDMPDLLPVTRFRLRHKNQLKEIYYRYKADIEASQSDRYKEDGLPIELALRFEAMAGDIDMFAESIAVDKTKYEEWAVKQANNPAPFTALLNKFMRALGE